METNTLEQRVSKLETESRALLLVALAVALAENKRLPDKETVKKGIDKLSPPGPGERSGGPNAVAKSYVDTLWPKPTSPGWQVADSR
jgi:hypothetical protein